MGNYGIVPDYVSWPKVRLQQEVLDLEHDLRDALGEFVEDAGQVACSTALVWLAERFEAWEAAGRRLFTISTALEFDRNVSPMNLAYQQLDIPPYAELLLQPGISVAFRHPEYMLARDLEFLYEVYLDTESLLDGIRDWSRAPKWAGAGAENAQTLARTVILACFNLVESFVSGLARGYMMHHPDLDEPTARKLTNTEEPLKKRVLAIPRTILGGTLSLEMNKPPFSELFGPIKNHRDAFVHCEPGTAQSNRGYVKQTLFHDVSPKLVRNSVVSTTEVIRLIWHEVYQRSGPRWLHDLDQSGRFSRANLTVCVRANKAPGIEPLK